LSENDSLQEQKIIKDKDVVLQSAEFSMFVQLFYQGFTWGFLCSDIGFILTVIVDKVT
jgi:hypothetical protein